ncbi:MAG: VOC family protein [Chloroflexia bacterium]
MILGIDHIVILVSNLDRAAHDYTALGFTVVPGGEHTGGVSHNALVAFDDGSYLELVAFKGHVPQDHFFYREGISEGLITYALLPGDIEADIEAARARGLEYAGPRSGGRLRPDGARIEWQIATPPGHDLPFLCGDVTPRELRVPGGDARKHDNGSTGIRMLTVQVKVLSESQQRYSALLGTNLTPPQSNRQGSVATVEFPTGEVKIVLGAPETTDEVPEGPTALVLLSNSPTKPTQLDRQLTHEVPLFL